MPGLLGVSPSLAIIAGALLGIAICATRLRSIGRIVPPIALVLVAVSVSMVMPLPIQIPAPLMYVLIGAGAVIATVRLLGGK